MQKQLIELVKGHCLKEVKINIEYPWYEVSDGTGDISRGRLEFAEGLLDRITEWEKK